MRSSPQRFSRASWSTKLDDLRLDRWSPDSLVLLVECPLALDQLAMPAEQGVRFEDQDKLLQLRFRQFGNISELLDQGQQNEFFAASDGRSAFLMTPQDQKLLTEQQQFEGFVIW